MKKYLMPFCLLTLALIYACSEEDAPPATPPDATKPVITIIAPTDITKPLRATVTVKAEATDDTGIAKVEVFVDGTSIASATTSPVEASWDTKTVTDGSHVIKIVAEDSEGNTEEQSITVEVQNVLFTFPVGAKYIRTNVEQWIFVSDEEGAVVSLEQLENGKTIVIETPEGFTKDKRYYFTRLEYYFEDFGFGTTTDAFYVTYADVRPGTYVHDFPQSTTPASISKHTVFVTGSPTFLGNNVVSLVAKRGSFSGGTVTLPPIVNVGVADLFSSPADVLYYFTNSEDDNLGKNLSPLFYRNLAAVEGGEDIVDYASLSEMEFNTINYPGAIRSYYSTSFLRTSGEYFNRRLLLAQDNLVSPDVLKIYKPAITYPEYITDIGFIKDDVELYYQKAGAISSEFKELQGSISDLVVSSNKISVTTSGTYSHIGIDGIDFQVNGNDTESYGWVIFGPNKPMVELTIPTVPPELTSKYPMLTSSNIEFKSVSIHDYIGIQTYDEAVDIRFSGNSIFLKVKERTALTKKFATSGGRIGAKLKNSLRSHDLPELNFFEEGKR